MDGVPPSAGSVEPYFSRVLLDRLTLSTEPDWFSIDGTVVFVDVSGFTALSERLARRGREGAEQITDAIDHCFGPLLSIATGRGGHLLKFGGDALLLLFHGPDHARIAAVAAIEMQEAIKVAGRIELPATRTRLRMSVGVHTGPLHLFVVGESHRELVVADATASAVVDAEHVASAGQIVVTPATAERLPAGWVGSRIGSGVELTARKVAAPAAVPSDDLKPLDPGLVLRAVPMGMRDQLLSADQSPEHRTATIAFVHFDGTDALVRDEGADAAARELHGLVTDVQRAVDDLGVCFIGTDVDRDGGKIILSAGAPTNTGNDEERMLLALNRICSGGRRLGIRMGVNRGPVFAGPVGPALRRTYTVMGDTVNLAARLMASAPPGRIYSTGPVLDESAARFDAEALEPISVKGKQAPIAAFAVGDVRTDRVDGGAGGPTLGQLPLIGRDPERAILETAMVAAVEESCGQLIELLGETGIGKTRLIEEARQVAAGGDIEIAWYSATCEAYATTSPYYPLRDVLRQVIDVGWEADDSDVVARIEELVAARAPHLGPWIPLLAVPIDVDMRSTPEVDALHPDVRRNRLNEVVAEFLSAVVTHPAVFEFENAHWIDEASAVLLDHLAGIVHRHPWVICLLRQQWRGGYVPRTGADEALSLVIHPVSRQDTVALARLATADHPLPPARFEAVVDRSGGNPQFLRDLLVAAVRGDNVELPDSVETAAIAAIDRLAPNDRTVVRRASLLGIAFDPDLLNTVLPPAVPQPDTESWKRLDDVIGEEGEGYMRFRREVIRDAAYSGLPYRLRRQLHAEVARAIESKTTDVDSRAETLSLHYYLAGIADASWRYSTLAGDRALARNAAYDATRSYAQALDSARSLDLSDREIASVWERLGEAYDRSGQFERAQKAFTSARRRLGDDPLDQARIFERHAMVAERAGRFLSAVRWTNRGLRHLQDCGDGIEVVRQRARLLARSAVIRQRQRRLAEAAALSREAIVLAEESGERAALARASQTLDVALVEEGVPTDGRHARRALDIFVELGDLSGQAGVLNNMGAMNYWEGRWSEARGLYDRVVEVSTRLGMLVDAAYGDFNVGEILIDQGLLAQGEERVRRVEQIWRGAGDEHGAAFARALLARAALRAGRVDEAWVLYGEAAAEHTRLRADADARLARIEALECRLWQDGVGEVLEDTAKLIADDVTELTFIEPLIKRVRGMALSMSGSADEARTTLLESVAESRSRRSDFETARTLDVLCAISAPDDADRADWTEERDEIFERLGVVRAPALPPGLPGFTSSGDRRAAASP